MCVDIDQQTIKKFIIRILFPDKILAQHFIRDHLGFENVGHGLLQLLGLHLLGLLLQLPGLQPPLGPAEAQQPLLRGGQHQQVLARHLRAARVHLPKT